MSLLEATKFLLRKHRFLPKKRLGQNFMVDAATIERMCTYASLCKDDVVLDVGAGLGFLARALAKKCKSVLAVELDKKLVWILREQTSDVPNIKVIGGDVLKVHIPEFNKAVSIPPYGISSRLLLWLFERNFDCAVLVLQKEFANRLIADVGSDDYGWLTVFTYYHANVELLDEVPKWMFYPPPKVDSIIVRLKPRKPPPFKLKNEELFRHLVRLLFTQRNRKVKNVFKLMAEETVRPAVVLPFRDRRVRELAPEDFGALANALSS
ncbi:MAG: 16S rRNA (adenine(1518)-N(6)/adenine(1519)-N(6))-dimethyltransferase RsmA [Candidatus Bathyarchaeia archaeon]